MPLKGGVMKGVHGLYISLPKRLKIDRRSRFGKALTQLRNSLVEDLGGAEAISTQVSLIVDRITFKVLKLCSYEAHVLRGDEAGMKNYLAMSNSLRLDLMALGLERKMKDITPLSERLAALAEKYDEEGNIRPGWKEEHDQKE